MLDHRHIFLTHGAFDGLPSHLIVAKLALFSSVACVKPIRITGYWYVKDSKSAAKPTMPVSNSEKVFLSLHGAFTTPVYPLVCPSECPFSCQTYIAPS